MKLAKILAPYELVKTRLWRPSSTFRRLVFSRHVTDLQLIALFDALVVFLIILCWPMFDGLNTEFVGTALAGCAAVLAWVYLTGSRRLGVIDLFACEIITLCRVFAIMDAVPRMIDAHKRLSGSQALDRANNSSEMDERIQHSAEVSTGFNLTRFTSEENYFTVFASNSADLQVLEADVVINVTEFYTYMKTFRDLLRRLGAIDDTKKLVTQKLATLTNAIYMVFLSFESARTSIDELIEFEPTRAEATVTILIGELHAYRFLTAQFMPDDLRGRRLALRDPKYCDIVPALLKQVHIAIGKDWETAKATAIDLEREYNRLGFVPKVNLFGSNACDGHSATTPGITGNVSSREAGGRAGERAASPEMFSSCAGRA